ncbi:hypothetical protein R3Q06_11255 [Rhodococcus erythropolis]|uniref:hypothetical protein n=1 Tax=Rhodococcus erythropolis TaxID=1833 RepID=UPI0029494C2E|nr:hypothetical protein [Rhodococcus erythropolis]MDV6274077.1 hypothetical protein [Rhodococcus erythropolis]
MSTVRVTLEAAGDLPESVREALQALITAATADGMGVEFSHKPSVYSAIAAGGHDFNFSGMSDEDLVKMTKSAGAMTFIGR